MAKRRSLTPDAKPSPAPITPVANAPDPAFIGQEPRILCVLLLDESDSMAGSGALEAVLYALPQFRESILKDSRLTRKLSWAVVTFAGHPRVLQDYGPVTGWEPPAELGGGGGTAMGMAILEALRLQDEHIEALVAHGIPIQHSFCFLVTDGYPNSEPPERFDEAAHLIRQKEEKTAFAFYSVAVEGADIEMLWRLTPQRTPLKLAEVKDITKFFRWLLESLKAPIVTQPGRVVRLPNPLKTTKESDRTTAEPASPRDAERTDDDNPTGWAVMPTPPLI